MNISWEIDSLREQRRICEKTLENYRQRIEQLELLKDKIKWAVEEVEKYQQSKINDVQEALDMGHCLRGVFGYFEEQYYYLKGARYNNCLDVSEELLQGIDRKVCTYKEEISSIRNSIDSLQNSIDDLKHSAECVEE